MSNLSKSDFKLARQCITKLYYKKMQYPVSDEGDPFMELLAEGGYMVGKLAQLLYPGIMIERMDTAVEETRVLLQQKNACIHEATIKSAGKIIRIDILNKIGKVMELIEVKSKSWDSNNYNFTTKKTLSEFADHLEDVAYQYFVLKEAYPDRIIKPYLFLPDKAKRTAIEGLNSMFRIKPIPSTKSGFKGFEIDFTGDIEAIRKDDIMTLVDVSEPVLNLQAVIKQDSARFLSTLEPILTKAQEQISIHCRDCEYQLSETGTNPDGFAECWGKNAYIENHILDLTQLGNINRILKDEINEAIAKGMRSYKELDADRFIDKYNNRPYYQVTADAETILPELFGEIQFNYSLCFIDFEVSKMALPYHKGMRPYENVAFQWSCHTLDKKGNLTHKDWINTKDSFPNFEFAESLMEHIRDAGTVLIWSSYENTILKDIYEQMEIYAYKNSKLKSWLKEFIRFDKADLHGFVDLAAIANKYYHHPLAMGRYGIKWLLPAVLQESKSLEIDSWLDQLDLLKRNPDGSIESPYDLLPEITVGESTRVNDGTGAVRAYQDMMYGQHKDNPAIKAEWEDALRQYCRLDTLAMVIIWEYWRSIPQKR